MTGKKIKVALCLSGEPRSSMASFPYIYETFLKNNINYETDIYTHSRSGFRALELYNPITHMIDISSEEGKFIDYLDNIALTLSQEKTKSLFSSIKDISYYSNNIKNSILMFEGINKCFNQIKKPYDIYIRGRFDLFYPQPFNIYPIIADILNKKYDLFIPMPIATFGDLLNPYINAEYNDQLAIGTLHSMKIYSDTFNIIPEAIKSTNTLNSQKWLKYWLDKHNLKVKEEYLDQQLIRKSMILSNVPSFNNFLDQ